MKKIIAGAAMLLTFSAAPIWAAEQPMAAPAPTAASAGHEMKEGAEAVGQGMKDGAVATGHAMKRGAHKARHKAHKAKMHMKAEMQEKKAEHEAHEAMEEPKK